MTRKEKDSLNFLKRKFYKKYIRALWDCDTTTGNQQELYFQYRQGIREGLLFLGQTLSDVWDPSCLEVWFARNQFGTNCSSLLEKWKLQGDSDLREIFGKELNHGSR